MTGVGVSDEPERFDVCVVGPGAAGQAVAIGAAMLGVRVALVGDGDPMDGSAGDLEAAALIAVADHAAAVGRAADFGLGIGTAGADFAAIRRHVEQVLATAAAAGSPERLMALGVTLIAGRARFAGPDRLTVEAGSSRTVRARRFVVATAGRAPIPAVPGLDGVPCLTPRGLAALDHRPGHLAILGNGAEAIEFAQVYRRLGSAVTLVDPAPLLASEDPELVELLLLRLSAEGVQLRSSTPIQAVAGETGALRLTVGPAEASETIGASHLLVATGRRPDLGDLDLAAAGVAVGPNGIVVDDRLRTTNRRIHALGDAIGGRHRGHGAAAEAGVVLRNILFRQRARFDERVVPRIVQADPGLAQVGLTEAQARAAHGIVIILRAPFHDNDRARAEGKAYGLVKVVTSRQGRILGVGIVGPHADELIQTWQLAIAQKLKIDALAGLIAAYPTLGEASRRAAGSFFAPKLLSAATKRLVRRLALLG
jgi:pyruvate/2-oxoglutarate dehydrogenase complex dihydrolipoamide dehydrogenase (E3) component